MPDTVSEFPKTIAVTGGSGQLGTLVLRRLAADPAVERIISIDLSPPFVSSTKLRAVNVDIRDWDLARHLSGCEAVVHCAFIVTAGAAADHFLSVNLDGSKNVFDAAAAAGVQSIVSMSSITAYGCLPSHPVPIRETTPLVDQTDFPYASCKFQVEALLDEFEAAHPDIAVSRIRANVLVGRHMRHLLGRILHIRWIPDMGGTPLPLVWDEDVADLVVLALRHRARGAFNAAADELLNADELADRTGFRAVRQLPALVWAYRTLYAALAKLGSYPLSDPVWAEKTRGAMLVATSERAKTELGWTPRYPTAAAVVNQFRDVAPIALDFRVQMFLRLASLFGGRDPVRGVLGDRPAPVRINLCLDGRTGRDLAIQVDAERFTFTRGPLPAPTSTIFLRDRLFRELLVGAAAADRARLGSDIKLEGDDADWETFTRLIGALVAQQRTHAVLRAAARLIALPQEVDRPDGAGR